MNLLQKLLGSSRKTALNKPVVSGSVYRYPITYDQPCQIDCMDAFRQRNANIRNGECYK